MSQSYLLEPSETFSNIENLILKLISLSYINRYYQRDAEHKLKNVPAVDNSLKWAGGGFLSTVGDLLQFGNAMLYSHQFPSSEQENETKATDVVFTPTPYSAINER